MKKYGFANEVMHVKLQSFIKRVRISVIHFPEKKNETGSTILRIKTIFGLATKNDGQYLDDRYVDHPPKVPSFGAGPKDVKFFLDSPAPSSSTPADSTSDRASGKGSGRYADSGSGKAGSEPPSGSYVSVFDFFEKSK